MPNHVSQDLFINGPTKDIEEFKEFAKEVDKDTILLSANKFIPYPQEYKILDEAAKVARKMGNYDVKDGFNSGGYEWCCKVWGTKWGIYDCKLVSENLSKVKGRVKYTFNSAWSPASKIILAMSERFPSLTFKLKYYEMGAGFKGVFVVVNGKIITDTSDKYNGNRGG